MEAGMERWGVPVPHSDDEEKTELALSFDDAEFQQDPAPVGSNGADAAVGSGGADGSTSGGGDAPDGAAVDGAPGAAEHLNA
jgi:hypothetical protein